MKPVASLICSALVLGLCAGVRATIVHVPSQYSTIQAGIFAASDGDTVLVADGAYVGPGNHDLIFGGRSIVVMSENGPEFTVIDCWPWQEHHRGFYLGMGEDSSSVIQGFTIINAYASRGGAIYCSGSSPTIVGNKMMWNTSVGAGVGCWNNSSPKIIGNTMKDNDGSPVYCHNSSPIIKGNLMMTSGTGVYCHYSSPIIEGNTMMDTWRGVFCHSSSPVIRGNRIIGNTTSNEGGGVYCEYDSAPLIIENLILGNSASRGGAIYGDYHSGHAPTIIRDNIIGWNTASWSGGGIYCAWFRGLIVGNTLMENSGGFEGGGMAFHESSPTIERNTITLNSAEEGGGIYCEWSSSPTVVNSILWGNNAAAGPEIFVDGTPPDWLSSIDVSYSTVEGGSAAVYIDEGCTLHWGEGNIEADPAFVLPYGYEYRLFWGSPCIDAGHPDSLDPDGTRRDMGAHFFDQDDYLTLYVTQDEILVSPGDQARVTYTVINRWAQPESLWVLTEAILPTGDTLRVMGPNPYVLPPEYTAQVQVTHRVPVEALPGEYEYLSRIGVPPATLYDQDRFTLIVSPP